MRMDTKWHCKQYSQTIQTTNCLATHRTSIQRIVFDTIQLDLPQTPQQDQWHWLILKHIDRHSIYNVTCEKWVSLSLSRFLNNLNTSFCANRCWSLRNLRWPPVVTPQSTTWFCTWSGQHLAGFNKMLNGLQMLWGKLQPKQKFTLHLGYLGWVTTYRFAQLSGRFEIFLD